MKLNKTDKANAKKKGERLTNHFCAHILFFILISLSLGTSANAELKAMAPEDLKSATAQAGFTDFSLNNNTARLFLDIHIETFTTINKFTAGNYTGGSDQSWTDVHIGTDTTTPLVIDGIVLMADFEEGTLGSNPKLERVIIGSNRLQGSISAMISSYTGIYSSALTSGGSPDTILRRFDPSNGGVDRTTFNFDSSTSNQGLFFILNVDGSNTGVQVVAGYNEKNIPNGPTGVSWWDTP